MNVCIYVHGSLDIVFFNRKYRNRYIYIFFLNIHFEDVCEGENILC